MTAPLTQLTAGMLVPFGGNRVATVSEALAAAFKPGDRLVVVQETGALLHIPAAVQQVAETAVGRAHDAFRKMGEVSDAQISAFFEAFAGHLASDERWRAIAVANASDVDRAKVAGRSTTRLVADDKMRRGM